MHNENFMLYKESLECYLYSKFDRTALKEADPGISPNDSKKI